MNLVSTYRKVISFITLLALVIQLLVFVPPAEVVYAEPTPTTWSQYEATSQAVEGVDFTSSSGIVTIKTEKGLAWLSNMANGVSYAAFNFSGITVKLEKASGGAFDLSGKAWTPISTGSAVKFAGIFDGQGSEITGLTISAGTQYMGLFGYISGAAISNLSITDVNISVPSIYYIGGVAGYSNYSTISAVNVSGEIKGKKYTGGLIGYNNNSAIADSYNTGSIVGFECVGGLVGENKAGTISKSHNTGAITGSNSFIGGLVGYNQDGSTVSNSYNTGDVKGINQDQNSIAGVVGRNNDSIVEKSYNTGTVSGATYSQVGGVVGYNYNATVKTSYNLGAVTGKNYVGGVVGRNEATGTGTGTVTNSYNTGTISGASIVGGVAGDNLAGTASKSYNIGTVTGTTTVGGVVGINSNTSTVSGLFWDTSTSGIQTAIGSDLRAGSTATGAATTEMQTQTTFTEAGWNFSSVWYMGQGTYQYPMLEGYDQMQAGSGTTTHSGGSKTVVDGSLSIIGNTIDGARVVIKNYKSGDKLAYTGTLPTGVSVSALYETGSGGVLTFIGTTSTAVYQALLRTVTFETTSTDTTSREVEFSLRKYKFVTTSSITWGAAQTAAEADTTYPSLKGYLATITSDVENSLILAKVGTSNTWFGASDATSDEAWYWMTGPEAGTRFWQGVSSSGISVGGLYNYWMTGEPNSATEDYGGFYLNANGTQNVTSDDTFAWNDFEGTSNNGYIIEYGGLSTDSSTATKTVIVQAASSSSSTSARRPAPVVVVPKVTLRFQIANLDSFLTTQAGILEKRVMDAVPIIREDRTLLPIRFVAEPLGGTVLWDSTDQKVTITRGATTIELWIGKSVAKVNGVEALIDPDNALVMPIIVPPGRTMLPLRFISETLGCTVEWDATTQQITVTEQ